MGGPHCKAAGQRIHHPRCIGNEKAAVYKQRREIKQHLIPRLTSTSRGCGAKILSCLHYTRRNLRRYPGSGIRSYVLSMLHSTPVHHVPSPQLLLGCNLTFLHATRHEPRDGRPEEVWIDLSWNLQSFHYLLSRKALSLHSSTSFSSALSFTERYNSSPS